jgi:ATP-dependent Clp protease protease subunit
MLQDQKSSGGVGAQDLKQLLFEPNISINGSIQPDTLSFFLEKLATVRSANEDLILELTTVGGDADVARRIAMEIRLFSRHSGRKAMCVGKSFVYSAGVTILAAFERANRYLTEDTVLLIHERRLQEKVELSGPIQACLQIAQEQLAMLKMAERLENEGFEELVQGSAISVEELQKCIRKNCYLSAEEAIEHGIIGSIVK